MLLGLHVTCTNVIQYINYIFVSADISILAFQIRGAPCLTDPGLSTPPCLIGVGPIEYFIIIIIIYTYFRYFFPGSVIIWNVRVISIVRYNKSLVQHTHTQVHILC